MASVGVPWRWVLCLALSGCGSSVSAPALEAPPAGDRAAPTPVDPGTPPTLPAPDAGGSPPDVGTPPPPTEAGTPAGDAGTAPTDGGTTSAFESEPSLPAHACIPWQYAAPPIHATACEVASVLPNGHRQRARYDADGRLLELHTTEASGAPISVETHTWRDGLEVQRRVSQAQGGVEQTDWTYDAQGRLLLRVIQGNSPSSTEYEYNDEGHRGWVTTRDPSGTVLASSDYFYDEQGRLTAINPNGPCGRDDHRCETLSYWPNGQLQHHHWVLGPYQSYSDWYNELGQLIRSTWNNGTGDTSTESTRTYDSEGRLLRIQEHFQMSTNEKERLTTRVYDPGGWRERFAEDSSRFGPCEENICAPNHSYTYRHITHRANFICGTSIVALDEWDLNEDGIVDARRTHTRDSTGRLVREEYSGTPGLDDGPLSRDFYYDCP